MTFYLKKARGNDEYWRKICLIQRDMVETKDGNAQSLPFENESFDAVLCVYLFHELPREIQAQVASEMARAAKVGGTVVLTDSMQRGDRSPLDDASQTFKDMNESYYVDYILDNLPLHFQNAGLNPMKKAVRSTTKMFFGRKIRSPPPLNAKKNIYYLLLIHMYGV